MTRTVLGFAPIVFALSLTLACGDDADPSTTMDGTGTSGDGDGDGDGDATTTGDGDGDPATGDGDGDPTTTDDPPVDTDEDGVDDSVDNCPEVANPNQLDYDGNDIGNVCDTQVFSTVGGTLSTTVEVTAGIAGDCQIPIMIDATGGVVRIQLDDDAAVAMFEINNLEIADILDQQCDLGFISAEVSLTNFLMTNSGGDFPVMVAHTLDQHDAGQVAGDSDVPHPVLATATLLAALGEGDAMESELELDGQLPVFTANVTGGGATGTLAWADPQFVIATDQFEITDPIALTIDVELRGMLGSLTLAP